MYILIYTIFIGVVQFPKYILECCKMISQMRLRLESENTLTQATEYYKAINWNAIEDVVDKATWEKLTEQFWLDTRIPLSNDLDDWRRLSKKERDLVGKVFGGLTLLDTLQSVDGVSAIRQDIRTPHEDAVLNNIAFMEAIHAKSYSSIFSTLNTKSEIEDIFEWTTNNPHLQKKAEIIKRIYDTGTPLQKKVASVFLESFLFYSGFFTPLWYLGNNKLPNVAEIIKLIIRDECLTKDQEVLTPKGWVSVADIRPQDLVLQFDKETRRTNFAPVSTISTDFAPKIYHFKSKLGYVELKCTPNHRLIRQALTSDKLIVRPADLTLGSSSYWLHPTKVNSPNFEVESLTKFEELYICLSKFGTVVESALSKHLVLSSSKSEIIAKMKCLLRSLKITYTEYSYPEGNGTVLRISKFNQFGIEESKLKSLPKRPLNEVDSNWCLNYLETLFDWVGAKCSDNSYRYCSINKESVDYVQALCSLLGYKTRIREFEDRSPFSAEGLVNYSLTILPNGSTSYGAAVSRTEIESEQIYGIQVPSGYLVTRSQSGSVVVTGNSVHGTYIGYKFQLAFNELSEEAQEELKAWTYDLLYELYENEEKYTEELYDEIGWTDEVKTFLRYNANKALMNLGFDPLFPESAEDVNPIIMNGISTGTSNHDFFSQVGNGYLLGQVEAMTDEDYTVGL